MSPASSCNRRGSPTSWRNCCANTSYPGDLYVELTETALIKGQVLENLYALHRLAIQIALDDFGTGYSSLSYLQNLPLEILKIDRSFILNLQESNNGLILLAIITMANSLGMKVIAKGGGGSGPPGVPDRLAL